MRIRISLLWLSMLACASAQIRGLIPAPRFWNDRDLTDWATPLAALDVRPGHFSEREYYAAPDAEWLRTYPVYFPGREPAGYWEALRAKALDRTRVAPRHRLDHRRQARLRRDRRSSLPEHRARSPRHRAIPRGRDETR